jgi:hypothetical protein
MTFRPKGWLLAVFVCFVCAPFSHADPMLLTDPSLGLALHGESSSPSASLFNDSSMTPTAGPFLTANLTNSMANGPFFAGGIATGVAQVSPGLNSFSLLQVNTVAQAFSSNQSQSETLTTGFGATYTAKFVLDSPMTINLDYSTSSIGADASSTIELVGPGGVLYSSSTTGTFQLWLGAGTYSLTVDSQVALASSSGGSRLLFGTTRAGAALGLTPAAAPEPGSFALMGMGAAVAGIAAWRRRRLAR